MKTEKTTGTMTVTAKKRVDGRTLRWLNYKGKATNGSSTNGRAIREIGYISTEVERVKDLLDTLRSTLTGVAL